MDSQNSKISILIIGATGTLGSLLTKYCLAKPNLIVNILVRDPQKNKEIVSLVENAGGKVIKGDVSQPETLKGITKGMHTVIALLPTFDAKTAVEGQIALINDCIENKVERVIPAEFSPNSARISRQELEGLPPLLNKVKVQEYLKTVPIKTLNINTGVLLDFYFKAALEKGFEYWGDTDFQLQLTTYDDTARLTADAIADKDLAGDVVFVSNEASVSELAEIYNRVKGTDLKPKKLGSLEDLRGQVEALEKQGNPNALMLKLLGNLFDERFKFEKTNNAEFPEVKKTSIEEYLKQTQL